MKIRVYLSSKARSCFYPSPVKKSHVSEEFKNPLSGFESEGKKLGVEPVRSCGSKEEIFFDSQAWLDSDCEDDFLSVNGEFTSSGCTTPNYQSSVPGTPKKPLLVQIVPDTKSEASPTDKKKTLADLFNESFHGEKDLDKPNIEIDAHGNMEEKNMQLKSIEGTPLTLGTNSVSSNNLQTPCRESNLDKERRAVKLVNCCLPSLAQALSFADKKKKKNLPFTRM